VDREKVWAAILEEIAQTISKPSFDTWFETTEAIDLNEHCLTVEVESEFQKNWLDQRYWNQINRIKDTILSEEIEVVFTVGNKKEATDIEEIVPAETQYDELLEMIRELKVRVSHLEDEVKELKE